jgi:hypothetical protein
MPALNEVVTDNFSDFIVLVKDFVVCEELSYFFVYWKGTMTHITDVVGAVVVCKFIDYVFILVLDGCCLAVDIGKDAVVDVNDFTLEQLVVEPHKVRKDDIFGKIFAWEMWVHCHFPRSTSNHL